MVINLRSLTSQTLQTLQTFCSQLYHPSFDLQPFYNYKPYELYKPFARRCSILRFTNLTNLLLKGIASSVLQIFYKLYKPYTKLLLEGIASSVLQTFYKP